MKTYMLASLEKKIDKWIEEMCDNSECDDFYITDDLNIKMAKAAELIFDANKETQKWLENNTSYEGMK